MRPISIISLVVAIIAISLSIITLSGKSCPIPSDNILALVGICTTLIVGVSVVDTITIHNLQKQVDGLQKIQYDLKDVIAQCEAKLQEQKDRANISNNLSWGLALIGWQPYSSFLYFFKGLELSLATNQQKGVESCLHCMEQVPKSIARLKKHHQEIDHAKKGKIPLSVPDEICKYEIYRLIKNRVEKVFKDIHQ